ncbi:MAG: lysophospholipid acyltransferase family protein [Methylobacterium sp.]|nr:lysophospholipid acyltransferase family protein [Methylobacterium sp.]
MKTELTRTLLLLIRLIAPLPLPVVHALGWLVGWIRYLAAPDGAALLRENLAQSQVCGDPATLRKTLRRNIGESGKALLETFAIWQRDEATLLSWVKALVDWEAVEAARAEGKGIIFLTPHLGCYEITPIFYAARFPITVLYRAPKKKWLLPLMQSGRARGQVKLATANTHGVRELLRALRQNQAIGILPDQIPAKGEGEWAPFFGRPAYTMTLVSRLAEKTGAPVIMVFAERLPWGRGFRLHFRRLPAGSIDTAAGLNSAIEAQVRQCPAQYLWSYHRYKVRRRAKPLQDFAAGAEDAGDAQ